MRMMGSREKRRKGECLVEGSGKRKRKYLRELLREEKRGDGKEGATDGEGC